MPRDVTQSLDLASAFAAGARESLFTYLRRQLLSAAWVGLFGGTSMGLLLGGLLASLDNAALLLPTVGMRLCATLLLVSVCAWASIAALLPVALLLACVQAIWPALRAVRVRRLYLSIFLAGGVIVFGVPWVAFRVVRDVAAPGSAGAFAVVAVLASLVFPALLWPRRGHVAGAAPHAAVVVAGLALSALGGLAAYADLSAHLHAVIPDTGGAARAPASAPLAGGVSAVPDVILVSIDTLRADHLSVNGYARHTSPHLDELAADGVNFAAAHSQAPWTLPSHAAMLVGRYPSACGIRFAQFFRFVGRAIADKLPSRNVTIAEVLHAGGFRTAAFTSTDYLTARFGFDQGFEQVEQADPSAPNHAETVVDKGIAWLAADATRPAFLFLHVYSVHQYSSPPAYDTLYQDPDYRGPLKDPSLRGIMKPSLSDADVQYHIAKYDGALRYVDDQLGRLFTWLRDHGRYDHTLLVVTSDHGEEFGDHGGAGHGFTLYEEQLHVPLIIKPPAGFTVHASRSDALAGLIDLPPTILDYVGLSRPPEMDGMSLRPAIETGATVQRSLFAEGAFFFNSYAIIRPQYKFIDNRVPPLDPLNVGLFFANVRSFYKFREDELYQIERDPQERANLMRSQPEVAAHMNQDLLGHIRAGRPSESVTLDQATRERLRALGYGN